MKNLLLTMMCVAMSLTASAQSALGAGGPKPMFLYYFNPTSMQMVYWTEHKEPVKTEDNAEYFDGMHRDWALQNEARVNAAGYTKMLLNNGRLVNIKYKDELLKKPNGEEMYPGELHSRPSIPSPGLRYALVNKKDAPRREYEYGELFVILHKDYLSKHQQLKVTSIQGEKPLPQTVVKQMEQKYGMKATRSVAACKIGNRYTFGCIQFEGEYTNVPENEKTDNKRALAVEVLIDGSKVYSLEVLGYFDNGYCTWNADDGGEYSPTYICAAFSGSNGLELCFEHDAPESRTVGMIHLKPNDTKLSKTTYAVYHAMIDEY